MVEQFPAIARKNVKPFFWLHCASQETRISINILFFCFRSNFSLAFHFHCLLRRERDDEEEWQKIQSYVKDVNLPFARTISQIIEIK
jgi:hypothetical protein